MLKLVKPSKTHEQAWKAVVSEFNDNNERITPFALAMNCIDYDTYLELTEKYETNNGIPLEYVPAKTFFLMEDGNDMILGAVNIRLYLNAGLLQTGGHIGYGVAPSQRRKGYASKMLELTLEHCKSIGLRKVLVTCDKSNTGSMRTIIKNDGVLEDEFIEENQNVVLRFWIEI